MQLAIQRTDQFKLFPVIVLPQYTRREYVSYCAILGCLAQIRTSSVVHAVGHVLRKSGLRQAISELVQRCGEALRHGFERRLESLALRFCPVGCPRGVSVVLP